MYIFKQIPDFRTINAIVRCYGIAKRSHYEVLNLRKNCTDKDIKNAFIQMSKAYHPDKNKDANAQETFVSIVEAYNILGKPASRAQYDHMMDYAYGPPPSPNYNYRTYEAYRYNQDYNTYHSKKDRSSSRGQTHWHGTSKTKKVPKYVIIMFCCGVAFVGTMLQVFIIRELYVIHRRQAMERSRLLSEELERVRAAALRNTNDMQTKLMIEKIVSASNPTVATASLGQALANERK